MSLAFFFLQPAIGKLLDTGSSSKGVVNYDVLPPTIAVKLGVVLPWIEIFTALLLLSGIALPTAGVIASVLLLAFILAISVNLLRGRDIDCNCSVFASTMVINWGMVVRDLILLIFAILIVQISITYTDSIASFRSWWALDLNTSLSSITNILFILLAICSCILIPYLLEWGVYIDNKIFRSKRIPEQNR